RASPAPGPRAPPPAPACPPGSRKAPRGLARALGGAFPPARVLEPLEPPLDGGAPALVVGRQTELFPQESGPADVPGCHEVLQRLLRQPVLQPPARGTAAQDRQQFRLRPFQLGPHPAPQPALVAVP